MSDSVTCSHEQRAVRCSRFLGPETRKVLEPKLRLWRGTDSNKVSADLVLLLLVIVLPLFTIIGPIIRLCYFKIKSCFMFCFVF